MEQVSLENTCFDIFFLPLLVRVLRQQWSHMVSFGRGKAADNKIMFCVILLTGVASSPETRYEASLITNTVPMYPAFKSESRHLSSGLNSTDATGADSWTICECQISQRTVAPKWQIRLHVPQGVWTQASVLFALAKEACFHAETDSDMRLPVSYGFFLELSCGKTKWKAWNISFDFLCTFHFSVFSDSSVVNSSVYGDSKRVDKVTQTPFNPINSPSPL